MDTFEKYLLLASLSFFFGCLAVSLILWNVREDSPDTSYMYTPAPLDATQKAPVNSAARQLGTLPKSVLHYPANQRPRMEVDCYLEAGYKRLIEDRAIILAATASIGKDTLEIYTDAEDNFFAFVIGPDAAGQQEACEVANGQDWQLTGR